MSTSAFTASSGGYPVIHGPIAFMDDSPSGGLRRRPAPAAATRAEPSPSRHSGRRPFVWAASISGALIPTTLLAYCWASLAANGAYGLVRGLLFLAVCTSLISFVVAVMHILRVRDEDRRADELAAAVRADLEALKASLKRHLDRVVDERLVPFARLAALDDDLRTRFEAQGRAYTALLDESCQRMGAEVGQIRQLVEGRLGEIEQRVDETEEKVEDLRTVARIFAEDGRPGGQVRQLQRPNGSTRSR